MTKQKDPSLAEIAGESFAILQHGIDNVIEWGFKKMKETGSVKDEVEIQNPHLRTAARAGKGVLTFLGRAGEAYYTRYADLKKDKTTK